MTLKTTKSATFLQKCFLQECVLYYKKTLGVCYRRLREEKSANQRYCDVHFKLIEG